MNAKPLTPRSFSKLDLLETLRMNPALHQAVLDALAEKEAAQAKIWGSTAEFARNVKILSDPPDPEMVPFELYPYQEHLAEILDSGQSVIILKARQLGASWLLGAYAGRRMAQDGWRIGYWSIDEPAAKHELERRILVMLDSLPEDVRREYRKALPLVEMGQGLIQIFAATQTAGTSYTFDVAMFDEFALHSYGAANYEHVRPTLSAGGQAIVNSTSNPALGPNGAFYDLWTAAVAGRDFEKHDSGLWTLPPISHRSLMPIFMPWDVRPGRDEAWLQEERKQYPQLDTAAFQAWYPAVPEQAFQGRAGLVHPQFSRARHVLDEHPVTWEQCTYRFAGYDLGGGDPTAIVFLGVYKAPGPPKPGELPGDTWRVHQFGEWYERRAPTITDLRDAFAQWPGLDVIVCDPKEQSMYETLRSQRYPVTLADWRREEGFETVNWFLNTDRLTIHASCKESIHEFAQYRRVEKTDPHSREKYATSTPVDHHADAMDARRYALMAIFRVVWNRGVRQTGPRKMVFK